MSGLNEHMITRRYREPRGLHSDREEYGFFVRVSGDDRELLKAATEVAKLRLGGTPSNPMLLLDMMSVYVGQPLAPQQSINLTEALDI